MEQALERPVSYTHLDVYKRQTETADENMERWREKPGILTWSRDVSRHMSMSEAVKKKGRRLVLEDACGWVSRGFLTVYPPGVPAVVPGEVISGETAELLLKNADLGLTVEGLDADEMCIRDRRV